MGMLIDKGSLIMLSFLSTLMILLLFFTDKYMYRKQGYVRFFIVLGLFASSIFGFSISSNVVELYLFLLLISFTSTYLKNSWCSIEAEGQNQAKIFFFADRVSDVLILISFYLIYRNKGRFEFLESQISFKDNLSLDFQSSIEYKLLILLPLLAVLIRCSEAFVYSLGKVKTGLPKATSVFIYFIINLSIATFFFLRFQPLITRDLLALS